jgi:hypothetical protein
MRSTTAPEMRAAVMIAKVPWYAMKRTCGMVPLASVPTPLSPRLAKLPSNGPPSPSARLYAATAQVIPTTPSATKLIIMVFSEFLLRTRPP